MNNTPVSPGPGPGDEFSAPARVRVSSPGDILAVVPHLLGFHPARSLVVVGAGRPPQQIELAFRYDLPDPPGPAAAAELAGHAAAVLAQRRLQTVIGIGYGPGVLVTPVADALAAAVRGRGLRLHELMRVEDGRYFSYICANPDCCRGTVIEDQLRPPLRPVISGPIPALMLAILCRIYLICIASYQWSFTTPSGVIP